MPAATTSSELAFEKALADIAAGASERDRFPTFPTDAFDALEAVGTLRLTVPDSDGRRPVSLAEEWRVVRRVATADASVGRVLDGHLNAVERLHVALPEPLRSEELREVAGGRRRLGVWGADPVPGEGEPARLSAEGTVEGVKVFCSGAGGLDRALVLLRSGEPGPPLLAYVDLSEGTEVDPTWYRGQACALRRATAWPFAGRRCSRCLASPASSRVSPTSGATPFAPPPRGPERRTPRSRRCWRARGGALKRTSWRWPWAGPSPSGPRSTPGSTRPQPKRRMTSRSLSPICR